MRHNLHRVSAMRLVSAGIWCALSVIACVLASTAWVLCGAGVVDVDRSARFRHTLGHIMLNIYNYTRHHAKRTYVYLRGVGVRNWGVPITPRIPISVQAEKKQL